jgi:hypothetical protein
MSLRQYYQQGMRSSSMRPTCRSKSIAILELLAVVVVTAVLIVRQRKWGRIINLFSVAAQLGVAIGPHNARVQRLHLSPMPVTVTHIRQPSTQSRSGNRQRKAK